MPVSAPSKVSEGGIVPPERDLVGASNAKKRHAPAALGPQVPPAKKRKNAQGLASPAALPAPVPDYATLLQRASDPKDIDAMNEAGSVLRGAEGTMSSAEYTHLAATYANSYLRGYTTHSVDTIDKFAEILEKGLFAALHGEPRDAFHQALVGVCDHPDGLALTRLRDDFMIYAVNLDDEGALNLLSHLAKGAMTSNLAASVAFEELAKDLRDYHDAPKVKSQAEAVIKALTQYRELRADYDSAGGLILEGPSRALTRIYNLEVEGVPHGELPGSVSVNMALCNAVMQKIAAPHTPLGALLAQNDALMLNSATIQHSSEVGLLFPDGSNAPTMDIEVTPLRLNMYGGDSIGHSFAVRASNAGTQAAARLINSGYGVNFYHQMAVQSFKRATLFTDGRWKRAQTTCNCASKSYRLVESEGRDPQIFRAIRDVRRAFFGFSHDDGIYVDSFLEPTNIARSVRDAVRAEMGERILNSARPDVPVDFVNTTFCVEGIPKENLRQVLTDVVAAAEITRPTRDASCAAIYNAMCAHTDVDALAAAGECDTDTAAGIAHQLQERGYLAELGPEGHRKLFVTKAFVEAHQDEDAMIRDVDAALGNFTIDSLWEDPLRRMVEHIARKAMERGYLVPADEPFKF